MKSELKRPYESPKRGIGLILGVSTFAASCSFFEMSSGGGGGSSESTATRKGYVDAIVPTVDPNSDLPGLEDAGRNSGSVMSGAKCFEYVE